MRAQRDEGKAFVFPGHPLGLSVTYLWSKEGDQAGARFGFSAASAGDRAKNSRGTPSRIRRPTRAAVFLRSLIILHVPSSFHAFWLDSRW